MSVFKDENNYYVIWWCSCDRDKGVNRWMVLKSDPDSILEIELGKLELLEFIKTRCDQDVWIEDVPNDNSSIKIHRDDIPEDYLPEEGQCLDPEED